MKNTIKFFIPILIIFVLNSCAPVLLSEKNLSLNLNETKISFCKEELDFDEDETLKLSNSLFGNDKYVIVLSKTSIDNPLLASELYYYYLFKNDILYYYGFPFQFHMNENDTIRIAGEEASKYAIQKDGIQLKY